MKINKFGTLAIIGVVASFTAACGGSPTKPTALNPLAGGGGSASSFIVSDPKLVGSIDQICVAQSVAAASVDENGEPAAAGTTTEAPAADAAPVMRCDVPASEPQADVVISDSSSMESARFANRR